MLFYLEQICLLFRAETEPSNVAIWDDFCEQHQHRRTKKAPNVMPKLHYFGANKVKI